jgi:hypothetical protein
MSREATVLIFSVINFSEPKLKERDMPHTRSRALRATIAALFVPLAFAAGMPQALAAAKPAKPAAAKSATPAVKPNKAFDSWADRFAEDWVRANPQLATSTQYFEGAEQDALDRQLTPHTREQRHKMANLAKTGVARLDAFLAGPLSEEQRTSASVMRWSLANTVASEPFEDYNFVFNQFSGAQVGLVNFMTNTHPMRRASDLSSYMAREGGRRERHDTAALHPRARPVSGGPLPQAGSEPERAGDLARPAPGQAGRRAAGSARQGGV